MRFYRATLVSGALAASLANFLLAMGAFNAWTLAVFGPDPAPLWAQWGGAFVLGFGLAWTTIEIGAFSLKIGVAAIALVETAALSWLLAWQGIAWPPFATLASGVFATLFGLFYSGTIAGRRSRLIEEVLGHTVSPATLDRVLESELPFPFQGEERHASAVVCRWFNRRELAETLSAADFVSLSNTFSATVSAAFKEAGGVVTEVDGEHVHAVFGALAGSPDHAARACRALLGLAPQIDTFRHAAKVRWGVDPDVRAAAETGALIAGVFGVPGAGGFGAVGEAIEAARRLAQANLFYGTRLLLGSRVYIEARGAVEARPADLVWSHNLREEIYEPLGMKGELSPEALERRDAYWIGLIHARSGRWAEAVRLLEPLRLDAKGAEDPLVRTTLDLASTLK
ncbi:MAG: adenylate/guanylate cyclase domain-containing protein [Chthoniobacteraceae bacterium]